MKKVWYSGVLKALVTVLFIASITLGLLTVTGGVLTYCQEEEDLYSLERDFSEAKFLAYLLQEPEQVVVNAYYQAVRQYDRYGTYIPAGRIDPKEYQDQIIENIRNGLEAMGRGEDMYYFIQWNDSVFTNYSGGDPDTLTQGEYYSYVKRSPGGDVERDTTHENWYYGIEELLRFDNTSTLIVSCQIKEEAVKEYRATWERQEAIVMKTFLYTLACAGAGLLALIYLICVCGKNARGEHKNMWLDRIWLEIHLAVMAGVGISGAALCFAVLGESISRQFSDQLVYWTVGTVAVLGSAGILTSLLSVIRNIKSSKFLESAVTFRIGRWLFRQIVRILKWMGRKVKTGWRMLGTVLSKKRGVLFLGMLTLYTLLMWLFGVLTTETPLGPLFAIGLFGFACFLAVGRGSDLDALEKGVREIRGGNVSYKIPKLRCEDLQSLSQEINDLAKGLDEAVSGKVKAERMKSELITNVSHDLKTPITSIISFTELLSKVEGLPEEAKDYVSVLAQKSDRLKKLTQDLFDISKAQSGNDPVVPEKLDVALLISQALGEQDREIQSSGLPFCVNLPKELYIFADGRKISRVLGNLIGNILKYTMKNTRVFITAWETEGSVVMELKNISAYPLNFDGEEITQRFVRGDESRTEEGNGLGLAIAKSYTELCGGRFEILVDGDLFKAVLTFPKWC